MPGSQALVRPPARFARSAHHRAGKRARVFPGAHWARSRSVVREPVQPAVRFSVERRGCHPHRGYSDSPNAAVTRTFDDFDQPTGFNSSGAENTASNVTVTHGGIANHSSQQRVAQIAWKTPGSQTYFQSNWTPPGQGQSAKGFKTLDFRVSRQCGDPACTRTDSQWLASTSFSVRLVSADGKLSNAIPISNYLTLTGPVGGLVTFIGTSPHPILQTIRVPLAAFGNGPIVGNLRGVRFTFDDTKADEIFIGNIRLSSVSGVNAAPSSHRARWPATIRASTTARRRPM
jgi:hypothetical protein